MTDLFPHVISLSGDFKNAMKKHTELRSKKK